MVIPNLEKWSAISPEGFGPHNPPDPLAATKRSTAKAIADLQKQIDAGAAAPKKVRPVRTLDAEAEALAEEKGRLRAGVDRLLNDAKPKDYAEKYRAYHRFAILSRTGSLAKLGMAATSRIAFTPFEELTGAPLSMALPGVSRQAGIQGGGLNLRAEMAALKVLGQRSTYTDALMKGKTGMNSLDARLGSKEEHGDTPSVLDLPGRIHGAIKTPAQRAAFARASVKLEAWAKRQGYDASDPMVKASLDARAYQESLRHILMNKNAATGLYRTMLSSLAHNKINSSAGKAGAAGLRALMPIVSVPTNFAGEVGLHLGGGIRAGVEIYAAGGIDNLTPEQADIVMRALKKQSVGAALFAVGYFNSDKFGGAYTPGQKHEEGSPDYGGLHLPFNAVPHPYWNAGPRVKWDAEMPHLLLHSPAMEVMTLGATFRKAMESAAGKPDADSISTLGNGTWAAAQGIAESVPFFDMPKRIGDTMQGSDKAGRFLGSEAASLTLPGIIPEAAGMLDKDADGNPVKRSPRGFRDELKMGAGLRRLVPTADERKTSKQGKLSLDPSKLRRSSKGTIHLPKIP